MLRSYFFSIPIAFFWTFLLVPIVRRIALRFGVVDHPDHRKVHRGAIPRTGGVAIFLGMILTLITLYLLFPQMESRFSYRWSQVIWFGAGAALVCIVGLIDDVRNLSARHKLGFQILAGVLACSGGVHFQFFDQTLWGLPVGTAVNWIATIFWIIAVTNAINLIDGLDGLAAGITIISALVLGVISSLNGHPVTTLLSMIIVGSAAGFLRYNIHPAKIFLGDSGSLLLGFLLATLSIRGTFQESSFYSMIIALSLFSVPLLDVSLAVLRRFIKGLSLAHADRDHIHHRLIKQGIGHFQSVTVLWVITLAFGMVALFLSIDFERQQAGLVVLLPIVLMGIALRRLGCSEVFAIINAIRYGNRRKLPPREKNIAVRKAVKRLMELEDIEAVGLHLIGLADRLDLDLMHVEATWTLQNEKKRQVDLVHWIRPSEQRRIPWNVQKEEGDKPDLSLSKITEGHRTRSGVSCLVVLGQETWKLRRQGESQFWASLLADGLSHWLALGQEPLAAGGKVTHARIPDPRLIPFDAFNVRRKT
ncbi:MAG: undecaprenyl/decaprenyl-phosphate alpha-N-acetylglucosaminyl 1-phosphate transferase [Nitrospirae bacterium]|nr:undecaprenyl/decaprenyl-phosphate alpha-N-acetylglucosaminyl 1-phosphate transferase [Nitrospirota bacterium]